MIIESFECLLAFLYLKKSCYVLHSLSSSTFKIFLARSLGRRDGKQKIKNTRLIDFVNVSMLTSSNADWIFLIMNTSVVVGSFSPALVGSSMRVLHGEVLISPTFAVKLDTEVFVTVILGGLSTAIRGKWSMFS